MSRKNVSLLLALGSGLFVAIGAYFCVYRYERHDYDWLAFNATVMVINLILGIYNLGVFSSEQFKEQVEAEHQKQKDALSGLR